MTPSPKKWTPGQARLVRKVCRLADDHLTAAIERAPAARLDLMADRDFVRVILGEVDGVLRRVVRAEQARAA